MMKIYRHIYLKLSAMGDLLYITSSYKNTQKALQLTSQVTNKFWTVEIVKLENLKNVSNYWVCYG